MRTHEEESKLVVYTIAVDPGYACHETWRGRGVVFVLPPRCCPYHFMLAANGKHGKALSADGLGPGHDYHNHKDRCMSTIGRSVDHHLDE